MFQKSGVFIVAAFLAAVSTLHGATIDYSGGTTPQTIPSRDTISLTPIGPNVPVVVGVFAPNFNPLSRVAEAGDICRYGDSACNLDPTYYFRMVADRNFIPLGETRTFGTGTFKDTNTATGIQDRQLWMILWDTQNQFGNSVLVTSLLNPNWLGVSDSGFNKIDLADVNTVVFGQLVNGRIAMGGLPMPEPSTWSLLVVGAGFICGAKKRNKRKTRL